MDGSPQTHQNQLEVPQAGDRGCQPGAINAQVVTIRTQSLLRASLQHRSGAASQTDTAWAQGRKWGSEAPPEPDCARPALGTRGSMGCKQPGEPLRRGVNKGISETVSEMAPAGRRNGTIPIPAHNREKPSPPSLAEKAGDKGEGATSGDSASLPRGQRGGHCEPQCRRWQRDRAGTGSKSHPGSSSTFSRDSASLAAKVSAFPAVPGHEPS